MCAANAAFAQVRIFDGTVIGTFSGTDTVNQVPTAEGIIGNIANDPTTWITTRLSTTTDYVISGPAIASNSLGDVIVIYEYFDTVNNLSQVAVAMLPTGTTTWIINTVSDGNSFANNSDHTGSIDDLGNVVVTWSAFNPNTSQQQVLCATSVISPTPAWAGPTTISQ